MLKWRVTKRRAVVKLAVTGVLVAGGVLVAPSAAHAAVSCQSIWPTSHAYYKVSCKKGSPLDANFSYQAYAHCTNGSVSFNVYGERYTTTSNLFWGPWSNAICPSGFHWDHAQRI